MALNITCSISNKALKGKQKPIHVNLLVIAVVLVPRTCCHSDFYVPMYVEGFV